MAKTKRVFELAKELGVSSKAIVAKCKAEDVPGVTNHMSTVKLGLAETIRQWFSEEAAQASAVETAEKVDLEKARQARRRRAAQAAADAAAGSDEEGAATATVEQPARARKKAAARRRTEPTAEGQAEQAEQAERAADAPEREAAAEQAAEAPASSEATEQAGDAEAEATAQAEQAASGQPAEAEAPAETAETQEGEAAEAGAEQAEEAEQPSGAVGQVNVPRRPTVVKPAGEQLEKPKEAKLKGPQVVRIEQPEPERRPRRERPAGGGPAREGGGGAAGGGAEPSVPGITRSRGPERGRGAGGGAAEEPAPPSRTKRRQQRNVRRGRSADALPTGPTKFSEADMEELDARLKGATGFLKQRRRDMRKREHPGFAAPRPAVTGGKVEIEEPITIKSLSAATGIKTADILKYLFRKGVMATINSAIDVEAAMEVALEYDIELDVQEQQSALQRLQEEFENQAPVDVRPRPPVVTVLGHVDHGKTSLLDRIRKEDVAAHEAGGITQHIGAYRVTIEGTDGNEKTVVFLDTPGHEAFTQMRSRGAQMTDLVVLVVAADDGVMPQTIESINHAKAAGVPILVALNKIDTPQATEENVRRIYGQLAEHGLNPVEWGGETEVIRTSAETGEGVTDLVEVLDFQAELQELTAEYGGPARGTVIEAEMQPGRGSVARVLVQQGQLKVGDFIVTGRAYGRVRDMTDDRNRSIEQAGPATPLELSGIDEIPDAGDRIYVTDTLQRAEEVASHYREQERTQQLAQKTKVTLDNFADQLRAGATKELRVVVKADVRGSLEVLRDNLEKMGSNEVSVRVIHSAVGGVTESDVLLADASDAIIIGFQVTVTPAVREIAEQHDVDIRLYRVIYDVHNEVKQALEGLLEPERREEPVGTAEVREVFRVSRVGNVAGCLVTEGAIQRGAKVRVSRDGAVVTDNRDIDNLKRVKDDVREVRAGTECGLKIAGFDDVKQGDVITCYNVVEIKRTLE